MTMTIMMTCMTTAKTAMKKGQKGFSISKKETIHTAHHMSLTASTNSQWRWIPSRATFLTHRKKRPNKGCAGGFRVPTLNTFLGKVLIRLKYLCMKNFFYR